MISDSTALNLFLLCIILGAAAFGVSLTVCRKESVKLRRDYHWRPWNYLTGTGVCLFYLSQALVLAALYFLVQLRG